MGRFEDLRFTKSVLKLADCPPEPWPEVAFSGRSNVGKSSMINRITGRRGLAKVSQRPGKTQALNFFRLGDSDAHLVDLPGYGYAKVAENIKREWQGALTDYLEHRKCLRGLMLMMDIRHPLKDYDTQMLEWAGHIGLPVHVLLTKADKLKRGPAQNTLLKVQATLRAMSADFSVQTFSSLKRSGIDAAHARLDEWFGFAESTTAPV